MIIRISKREHKKQAREGDTRVRNRFLFLPKNITHDNRYVIRWAERAEWAEEFQQLYNPEFKQRMRALRFGDTQLGIWSATKWLDIEEAAVDGLNKLNTAAENPVEQYPYK